MKNNYEKSTILDLNQESKLFYTISEVAEMLQVSPSTIRFWENEFDMLQFSKNSKGDRRFTREDIEDLQLIYQLTKVEGYRLEASKEIMRNRSKEMKEKLKTIAALKRVKEFFTLLKKELSA